MSLDRRDLYVINSFSKYFGMTGWRVGWVVGPADSVAVMDRLAQNLFIAANTPAQHAALAAFGADTLAILETRREVFRQRRDRLLPALRDLGFGIPRRPDGAFYLYAGLPEGIAMDSMHFVDAASGRGGGGRDPRSGLRRLPGGSARALRLHARSGRVGRRRAPDSRLPWPRMILVASGRAGGQPDSSAVITLVGTGSKLGACRRPICSGAMK